ncbi:hypothetical protein K432DRAFT_432096 [Lepidopterella palustris CBS 459.81]|uniref:protein disulfide-isomerase n=1 Tax=Lepidopterella palustris CBS 459.81 TaxID=1314670 RepID=A0A8E2EIN3_9PEZI|nr:hypothetical protein K432DRAFT_432096 [Lepidopterella palustris CBS 459.81]
MVHTAALVAAAASLLFTPSVYADGMYAKNSPVLQINGMEYDRLIAKSNYTSIVEFYAPWCGHCKNLKPAYESAAKSLAGLAKVAAINCDDEFNKPFCGTMGIQGFPTLKIIRPGKKQGRPIIEDYQGQRAAKPIVDAVKEKIPNHVKRVTDKGLEEWLQEGNETAKAVLFSDKGVTSATLRALAIDFAGTINIAQIRNKEKAAMELFGISSVPTLVLLPGGDKDSIVYSGEMKKETMSAFLSQIAPPNPDCPPEKEKKPAKKPSASKKDSKKSSSDSESAKASATAIAVEDAGQPTESPDPNVVTDDTPPPVIIPEAEKLPSIPLLESAESIQKDCLSPKSKTCILALLPPASNDAAVLQDSATTALASLSAIHKKHDERHAHLFPFYGVPASNPLAATIRSALGLGADTDADVELIATNAKRGWWKRYQGAGFEGVAVEDWVDAIRMGDGKKEKLPESLIVDAEEVKEEKVVEPEQEQEPFKIEIEEILDGEEEVVAETEDKAEEKVGEKEVPEHGEL